MTLGTTRRGRSISLVCMLCRNRWRGSIYRFVWKEFAVFVILYFLLSLLYRFALNDDGKRYEYILWNSASEKALILNSVAWYGIAILWSLLENARYYKLLLGLWILSPVCFCDVPKTVRIYSGKFCENIFRKIYWNSVLQKRGQKYCNTICENILPNLDRSLLCNI